MNPRTLILLCLDQCKRDVRRSHHLRSPNTGWTTERIQKNFPEGPMRGFTFRFCKFVRLAESCRADSESLQGIRLGNVLRESELRISSDKFQSTSDDGSLAQLLCYSESRFVVIHS